MLLDSPRRALQINPNFAMAHSWMGAAHALTGDGASAFKWIEKARKLSPRDMFKEEFDVHTSYAYFQIGDYQNAYAYGLKAMLPHPEHVYPRLLMATSLAHLGNLVAAEAQARRIRELVPGFTLAGTEKSCVFVRDNDIARFIDGLRLAGLP
jgi:tetratricopeptide (TPR) repeat protein